MCVPGNVVLREVFREVVNLRKPYTGFAFFPRVENMGHNETKTI
jgi:hypothetical protein